MSGELARPFDSIESAQEFITHYSDAPLGEITRIPARELHAHSPPAKKPIL